MGIVESLHFLEASHEEELLKIGIDITELDTGNNKNRVNEAEKDEKKKKIIPKFRRKFLFSKL